MVYLSRSVTSILESVFLVSWVDVPKSALLVPWVSNSEAAILSQRSCVAIPGFLGLSSCRSWVCSPESTFPAVLSWRSLCSNFFVPSIPQSTFSVSIVCVPSFLSRCFQHSWVSFPGVRNFWFPQVCNAESTFLAFSSPCFLNRRSWFPEWAFQRRHSQVSILESMYLVFPSRSSWHFRVGSPFVPKSIL